MEERVSEHIATEPEKVEEKSKSDKHDERHRRKHLKQHDEEWPSSHEQDEAAEEADSKVVAEEPKKHKKTCPEAKVEKGPCGGDGYRQSTVTSYSLVD